MATNGKIEIDTTYGHPLFYELVLQMARTHAVKNQDYGGGNPLGNFYGVKQFNGDPVEGVMTRLSDKWSRLCNLHAKGGVGAVKDESIEDTALDLACYALLYIVIRRECFNSGGKPKTTDLVAEELFNELVRREVIEPALEGEPMFTYLEANGRELQERLEDIERRFETLQNNYRVLDEYRKTVHKKYLKLEAEYLNLQEEVLFVQEDKAGLEREVEALRAQLDHKCKGSCKPGDVTHVGRSSPGLTTREGR